MHPGHCAGDNMEIILEIPEDEYRRYRQYYEPYRIDYRRLKGEGVGVFNGQAVQLPPAKKDEVK